MYLTIRPYRTADFDAVTLLRWNSWKSTGLVLAEAEDLSFVREMVSQKITCGSHIHVVIAAAELVGFVAFYDNKVQQLFTTPTMQGNGIGKQILDFVKTQRPAGFWLTSLVENGRANRFYEREGLKRGETSLHHRYGPIVRYDWPSPLDVLAT